jgi:hypothetical protein
MTKMSTSSELIQTSSLDYTSGHDD